MRSAAPPAEVLRQYTWVSHSLPAINDAINRRQSASASGVQISEAISRQHRAQPRRSSAVLQQTHASGGSARSKRTPAAP